MGGKQSKTEKAQYEKIDHPNFEHVEIVQSGDNKNKLIKMRVPVNGEKMIKDWENGLKLIKSFDQQSLLLPTYHSFQSQGLCGTSGILNIFFQYYPYLLSEEIFNRKDINKQFDQNQLWYLLYVICSQATQFHFQGQKLGDIRPQNIFINDEGYIKLANIYSWPNSQNNYEASLLNNQVTYLSPQELTQQLQYGKNYPETSTQKSESFSIGMTLLDCIMLDDFRSLYNLNNYQFSNQKLQKVLQQLQRQRISPYLKRFVTQLCEVDPNKRITARQICDQLKPHAQKIKNLQDFQTSSIGYPYGGYGQPTQSYMYSSQVTKGFTDQFASKPGQRSPYSSQPYESKIEEVSAGYQGYKVQPKRELLQSYQPQILNTGYQPNNYQPSQPIQPTQASQINTYYQSNNKYEINDSYKPNTINDTNYSPLNNNTSSPPINNYANTYSSSYSPNFTGTNVTYTKSIQPNDYKISPLDSNPISSEPTSASNNAFKHTLSTYVQPGQAKRQAPPSLPEGTQTITYQIDPALQNLLKQQQNKNNQKLNQLLDGINNKPKQFLSLQQIDRKIEASTKQYV